MPDVTPDPKARTLARGQRRYRRKVASPKQWQAIIAAKGNSCRLCEPLATGTGLSVQYHHVVARNHGGDDLADNIVPLCSYHHAGVTARAFPAAHDLPALLTDAEYAYMVQRGGEGYPTRAYGIEYTR